MFESERASVGDQSPNKIIWIVVVTLAVIIIGGMLYLRTRVSSSGPAESVKLANAIRPGTPEWNQYREKIVLDKPDADEGKTPLGVWSMGIRTTVRNFTGKTITGLEMHAAVVDLENRPVKERTAIVIPGQQSELEPNKTTLVTVRVEGMKDSDQRANIQLDITGFTLK